MEYITQEELVTLNEARDALERIGERARMYENGVAGGMIYAMSAVAGGHLFQLFNWTNAYGHQDIPDDVMHNTKKVTADVG